MSRAPGGVAACAAVGGRATDPVVKRRVGVVRASSVRGARRWRRRGGRAMRALIGVLVLAAVGAGGFFAYRQFCGGGVSPAVGAVLSAEHTVVVIGMEHLDEQAAQVVETLQGLPDGLHASLAAWLDPAQRIETLGFDPTTPEGWASIGVDPEAGVAVVVDRRLVVDGVPAPVLMFQLTDRDKLHTAIEKWSGVKPTVVPGDEFDALNAQGTSWLVNEKGGWTALLMTSGPPGDEASEVFRAFITDTGTPLSDADTWKDAFADGDGAVEAFAYVGVRSLDGPLRTLGAPSEVVDAMPFYGAHFPALGVAMTRDAGLTVRISATEVGLAALQQLVRPERAAPAFSRYLPAAGWSGARVSVNLAELFVGAAALVPPNAPPHVKAQLEMANALMSAAIGVDLDDFARAFSGHVVMAANVGAPFAAREGPAALESLYLLGVVDPDASDTLVQSLVEKAGQMGAGPLFQKAEIAGAKGWQMATGPITMVAVRDADVWLFGPEHSVAEALANKHGENLQGKVDVLEDAGVVFGFWLDLREWLDAAPTSPTLAGLLESDLLKPLRNNPTVGSAWRLDDDGLLATTSNPLQRSFIAVGVTAAVAVPAFMKEQRLAKTAEARANVRRLFDAASRAYRENRVGPDGAPMPRAFPPSTTLTPTANRCVSGNVPYAPDPSLWDSPGWRALSFAVGEPHYYRYQFISAGIGRDALFTARALGDLNCDGTYSTFEWVGRVDDEGNVSGGAGLYVENELE